MAGEDIGARTLGSILQDQVGRETRIEMMAEQLLLKWGPVPLVDQANLTHERVKAACRGWAKMAFFVAEAMVEEAEKRRSLHKHPV